MPYLLVIGDVKARQYEFARRQHARIKRVTEHEAVQGDSWSDNEVADRLRELLACEPVDVNGIIMPETAWLNDANILTLYGDYFPGCPDNCWVVRPDGSVERV